MKYFLDTLRLHNETLFYYGLLCFFGAFVCLVLVKIVPNPILGVSGWMKPFKFMLSTAILAWSMGFYMQFLDNQAQVRLYNWSLIVLLSVEIILITYQASKGTISHFNEENETGKIIFSIMALAITYFMLHTAYMSILFMNQSHFIIENHFVLAIILGIVITVIFAFEGLVMGAIMRHTVGALDGSPGLPVVNWSRTYGDLRVAHFFGLHALQIIPLLSYLFAKSKRDVVLIATIYFILVSWTFFQALRGKPFINL